MLMPMNQAKEGNVVEVKGISTKEGIGKRLGELGLVLGNKVKIVKNDGKSIIIAIEESRFALDLNLASKIMIAI